MGATEQSDAAAARPPDRTVSSPPSLAALFARAGAGALPLVSRLPFLSGGGRDLPDVTLSLEAVKLERERLISYNRVCGFRLGDVLPPTFPHVLAFPLQLALMTDARFPFPAIGLVHIANRITQHRPIRADETLSLRVWAADLRPHPRGMQFSLRTEARAGDELVWEEVATNLRRGAPSSAGGAAATGGGSDRADPPASAPAGEATATWRLRGDLGRRYGAVSGDLNPIHLHPLSARLFGFPRAIAHGMWTTARCLAALEPQLPERLTVDVEFRKPIVLPATVGFAARDEGDRIGFEVRDPRRETLHLRGELTRG